MSLEITKKLDRLANLQAERDVLALEKQAMIDEILTPEIKARIASIEADFAARMEEVEERAAQLEAEIRDEVLRHGTTVRGEFLFAVWNRGRVTWDSKGMEGYAVSHPEVLAFRKEGAPSVSIRKTT